MRLKSFVSTLLLYGFLASVRSSTQAGTVEIFFNFDVLPGTNLIGNPLYRGGNSVSEVMPTVPAGTQLLKFANNAFITNRSDGVEWDDPRQSLAPGEGAFLISPLERVFTLAIAGQTLSGRATNRIPAGLSIVSAMIVRSGAVSTELGLVPGPFDNLYLWRTNRFETFTFLPTGRWFPSEPRIARAEAFFINADGPLQWIVEGEP